MASLEVAAMTARKHLAKREPSGRISRAVLKAIDGHSPAAVKRLQDAALRGIADPDYGTELGRLALTGKISPTQREAGRRWCKLREEFVRTLGIPLPSPGLPNLNSIAATAVFRDRYERDVYDAYKAALIALRAAGNDAAMTIVATCEYDQACTSPTRLKALHLGLNALATHWGLT